MVVITSEANETGLPSPSAHTTMTFVPTAMPSVSNCNGQIESSNTDADVSPSSYQMLLKQVENLRKENSSLKAEASRMKGMVLMLGTSPGVASGGIEAEYSAGNYLPYSIPLDENGLPTVSDDNTSTGQSQNHIPPLQSPMKLQNGLEQQENKRHRPEFLPGLNQMPQNFQSGPLPDLAFSRHQAITPHGTVSPSPTMAVADVIRKLLMSLKTEKASSLRTLHLEEQKKEYYLKQLKELTSRLDNVSESDKFTKPNDKTRQQIEIEIANLAKTMEQSLGSGEVMQERLEARLKHIQFIESEIASLEQHLCKLEITSVSPAVFLNSPPGNGADGGGCSHHGNHHRNGMNFSEISTQTPRLNSTEMLKHDEESLNCSNQAFDLPVSSVGNRISRTVQTVTSCLGDRSACGRSSRAVPEAFGAASGQHGILTSKTDPKTSGSIDSLPSQSDIDDAASMHSFTTSLPPHCQQSVGHKRDGLLSPSLLHADKEELRRRFLKMTETVEGCRHLKQTGCVSLIMQIAHDGSLLSFPANWTTPVSPGRVCTSVLSSLKALKDVRIAMGQALWNIVNVTTDAKPNPEMQIFDTLEILRRYCEQLYDFWIYSHALKDNKSEHKRTKSLTSPVNGCFENGIDADILGDVDGSAVNEKKYDFRAGLALVYDPPITGINAIRKLSYYEAIKRVINEYGGLYAVAELFILHCRCVTSAELVHLALGNDTTRHDVRNMQLLKRFIGFSFINLTYGDTANKTSLIQMPGLIDTIVAQMGVDSEEIQQVMSLFVRNLSWQLDEKCRDILRQKNVAAVFMKCALKSKKEDTLKSLLSALWNLSGHCPENRASICSVKGALAFLAFTLTHRVPEIIENGGGILKNVSSVVATNEEYRKILREKNCLKTLLDQLKAASLTIVSNACGTLWNLSARNAKDQKLLWDLNAVPMLRSLVHSKHKAISEGSSAALRNLLMNAQGNASIGADTEKSEGAKLKARKQKSAELFESNIIHNTPEHENFSPRHHAQSTTKGQIVSARSAMTPQRHSLQEKSSSSPVADFDKTRRFQKGGLQYSGSLGSLPSSEFSDSFSKPHTGSKYIPTARNSNSYPDHYSSNASTSHPGRNTMPAGHLSDFKSGFAPVGGGMLKDVMIFNDMPQKMGQMHVQTADATGSPQSSMSLRQCLKMIGERKMPRTTATASSTAMTSHNTTSSQPQMSKETPVNSRSLYYPGGLPPTAWGGIERSSHAHPSGGQQKSAENSRIRNIRHPQPQGVQKVINNLRITNVGAMPNALVPQCPEDLVKRLHDVEDDYENDDDPVNYSLQYGDDLMTPGIQSPRTEEIYELAADRNLDPSSKLPPPELRRNYMNSQLSGMPSASLSGPATKSDGGLSGLSSCIGSTGSSAAPKQDVLKSAKISGLAAVDGNTQLGSSMVNFPADRNLVDPSKYDFDIGYEDEKPKNFSAIYSEEQLYERIPHESMGMQPFAETEAPSFPSETNANDVDSPHPNEASYVKDRVGEASTESREESDKFDTGTFTQGHNYYHHRSGRNSGIMTPRTPFDDCTPLVFSRCSSLGSVSDGESIHSEVTSEPASRMMSGAVSPSHLPDSPSQSMPISPRRSPPPRVIDLHPADVAFLERKQSALAESKHTPQRLKPSPLPTLAEADKPAKPPIGERIENQVRKIEQPGYVTSMPHKDEMNVFRSEGAMSVMTKFSSLTIDSSDKIQPIAFASDVVGNLQSPVESKGSSQTAPADNASSCDVNRDEDAGPQIAISHAGQRAICHAGYITSLPTNDEIKKFMHEGTLSPISTFSEISCLKADNDGFQKSTGSVFSVPNSTSSHRAGGSRSFASRSSATGASVPLPPPDKWNTLQGATEVQNVDEKDVPKEESDVASPTSLSIDGENKEEEDEESDSLPGSSSEDEDLLQQCIQRAIPKKASKSSSRSTSSKASSRSNRSSRAKDKSSSSSEPPAKKIEDRSATNPSPEAVAEKDRRRIDIKKKIESANMKLQGVHIVDYIDNLISKSEGTDDNEDSPKNASAKSKQVIDDTEKLQQSYSVRKKLKEAEKHIEKSSHTEIDNASEMPHAPIPKTTGLLPSEPNPPMQSKIRIQSFIREEMTAYGTEGTPIEMSRCTSLSNLTIDSESNENQDFNALKSGLKTSHSVPDFQSGEVEVLDRVSTGNTVNTTSHVRTTSFGGSDRSSPIAKDSRDILDNLGKQIENLTISIVENVITSSEDPGYTRSMPHSDEICKYNAEGSQFGGTEFSALTIDSETRIAPGIPTEIILPESSNSIQNAAAVAKSPDASSPPCDDQSQNSRHMPPVQLSTRPSGENQAQASLPKSSNHVTTVIESRQPPSWEPNLEPQTASHYNDENDNLAMKEEKRNYMIEDTPLNLSGPGSLSSLDFGSDDDNDLLTACITSALPPERKSQNPPYPTQLLLAPPISNQMDMLGRYSHRVPDGKVDSPTGQQIPMPSMQHHHSFGNSQMSGSGFPASFQTPSEEQFMLFQQEAEAISAHLMQRSQYPHNHRIPTAHTPDMPLSSSLSLTQPTDGYYRLSRQASMQDSDLSISSSVLGERQTYDAKPRNARSQYSSASKTRKQFDKSSPRAKNYADKNAKSGKNFSPDKPRGANATRRGRNAQNRARDSSSGSSSSYQRHHRRRHMSGTNRSSEVCNCQVACSRPSAQCCCNHGPVSASASHIMEGMTSPSRPRRKSTNSASKNSLGACEHNTHHHQPKPNRPRNSSRNLYLPSVVQLYPPLKDMVGVLEGVATVAARGDKVVADRPPQNQSNMSKKSSSSPLVRSGTFINENPSQILLENMTQEEKEHYATKSNSSVTSSSPPQSQNSKRSVGKVRTASPHGSSRSLKQNSQVPSRRGSTHSLKAQSTWSTKSKDNTKPKVDKKTTNTTQTKPKHKKVWSGIKKLLSPSSEDPSSPSKELDKSKGTPKKGTPKKTPASPKTSNKAPKPSSSNRMNPKQKEQVNSQQPLGKKIDESGASSLSLSSSSASNNSSDAESRISQRPVQNTIAPYGLLPKSPSVNAVMRRTVVNIPQSRSMGILHDSKPRKPAPNVWRKTPPKLPSQVNSDSRTSLAQSSKSSIGTSPHSIASRSKTTIASSSEDVWISKKVAAVHDHRSIRGNIATTKIPVSRGQKLLQPNGEYPRPQASGPPMSGFQSPPRTQSPRVVQQVAPFNYKPSSRKGPEQQQSDKNTYQTRKISPDCKQTPV